MKAYLALEDGTVYEGDAFGATGTTTGEAVFNTSMSGYQEILSDPSYVGQIVVMTYPLIGNYGVAEEDFESDRVQVEGFAVREYTRAYSSWRATTGLDDLLQRHGIIGIEGIDTRALTRRIRAGGELRTVLSTEIGDHEELVRLARNSPGTVGEDLVKRVTRAEPEVWQQDRHGPNAWLRHEASPPDVQLRLDFSGADKGRSDRRYHVVAYDFGIKRNIARELASQGCDVTLVPADMPADAALALEPDGICLSNGPGDPDAVGYAVETIRNLIGKKPIFGICLGHQLIGLALGGDRYKMKFGHRGANQPVMRLADGAVEITSQNHSYCVDADSLKHVNIDVTHVNLNDQTVEGLAHRDWPLFCVQYHPEASPGPHDAKYLFDRFLDMMRDAR